MLTNAWFYNQTLRKLIVAFGSIFNGIKMKQLDANTLAEITNVTVPITFEGKETFVTRLFGDPNLNRGVQIQLPAMSYEFKGIKYDENRKLSPFLKNTLISNQNKAVQYSLATPYDAFFELNVYTRNWEDSAQIIEQIIPYFNPDYTVTLKYLINGADFVSENLPIVLEGIDYKTEYEGTAGTVRDVVWSLQFTAHTLFYGPTPTSNVIKEVFINLRDGNSGNLNAQIQTTVNPPTANAGDNWTANTVIIE